MTDENGLASARYAIRTVFLATSDFSRLSEGIGVCADAAATDSKSAKDRLANRSSIFVLQLSGSAVPLVARSTPVSVGQCRTGSGTWAGAWAQLPNSNRWSGFQPAPGAPAGASRAGNRAPPLTVWPGTPISAARGPNVSPAPDTTGSTGCRSLNHGQYQVCEESR